MTLFRHKLVKHEASRKYSKDMRQHKSWAVFEYRNEKGHEYRKAFWADKGTSRAEFELIAPQVLCDSEKGTKPCN